MNRYSFIDKLREELEKEDKSLIDFNRCSKLINQIEDEMEMLESESQDFEEMNYDLERKVEDLEEELDVYQTSYKKPETLDEIFKDQLFTELSKKYTHWKLEELLKNNRIL